VAAAIDARAGRVAIRGWKDATDLQAVDLARRVQEAGVAVIIYTDVERDGMGGGVNIQATRDVARSVAVPVIASGGVGTMEDLSALLEVAHHGIEGVIVGRALYEGSLDLGEAMEMVRGKRP
jgi:phosphoribosylformimino-5-aminoimidazole carboxamide ribotide isomerase